jgi:hypothetical protein
VRAGPSGWHWHANVLLRRYKPGGRSYVRPRVPILKTVWKSCVVSYASDECRLV